MNLTEILKNISLIAASLAAIYGIGSWRREFRGKRQAELVEEVLSLFYEAQDAIRHIRNPFAYGNEGTARKVGEKETPDEKEAYDKAYVVFERYNSHRELFNKLRSIRYRFMAQFGLEAAKPFEEIQRITNEILTSAQVLARLWARQNREFRTQQRETSISEQVWRHETIFWEGLAEEDPIKPRLEQCISEIEKICTPILFARMTFFSFLSFPIRWMRRKGNM